MVSVVDLVLAAEADLVVLAAAHLAAAEQEGAGSFLIKNNFNTGSLYFRLLFFSAVLNNA